MAHVCDYCGARMEGNGQGMRDTCPNGCDSWPPPGYSNRVQPFDLDQLMPVHARKQVECCPEVIRGEPQFQVVRVPALIRAPWQLRVRHWLGRWRAAWGIRPRHPLRAKRSLQQLERELERKVERAVLGVGADSRAG